MSTSISYKCDDCHKEISWDNRHSLIRIEIGKEFSDTILRREYCQDCWNKRKEAVLGAAR